MALVGAFVDAFEVDILKWITGQTTTIIGGTANTPWVALFTTMPDEDGTTGLVECSGTSYARVNSGTSKWGAPSTTSGTTTVTNSAGAIAFATAGGAWGTIVGVGIYTASTSGTLLATQTLTASKVVGSGDTAQFATSTITIGLT
jgi:hypothetical protein